jgi:hypothetical protein
MTAFSLRTKANGQSYIIDHPTHAGRLVSLVRLSLIQVLLTLHMTSYMLKVATKSPDSESHSGF